MLPKSMEKVLAVNVYYIVVFWNFSSGISGNHQNNSVMVSDSDLESDTLFEQNGKTIGRLSNGFSKLPDEGGRSPQKVRT